MQIPRFTPEEVMAFLNHYAAVGAIAGEIPEDNAHNAYHLTRGNAKEVRQLKATLAA